MRDLSYLPRANRRGDRVGTDYEDDGVRFTDETQQLAPPVLKLRQIARVDLRCQATGFERSHNLLRKGDIFARVGNKDFEFLFLSRAALSHPRSPRHGVHSLSYLAMTMLRPASGQPAA